jgi:subtilisin family serine protease
LIDLARSWVFTLVAVFAVAASAVAMDKSVTPTSEPYYPFVRGEVLVKFVAGIDGTRAANVCAQVGGKILDRSGQLDFYRVRVAAGTEKRAVESLRAQSNIEWANLNYIAHALFTPNDPDYVYQWHYPKINLPQAWDITRGVSTVVVAVCDMGWYFNHEDWASVVRTAPWDFIDNDNDPSSTADNSHGMHVAGTIFADTDNNLGVAGIAPLCTLMPVRVLNDSGQGTEAQIANGISWAATHGAKVLNLSLGFNGGGVPQDPGPPLSTAIFQAADSNVVICAAAGNDGGTNVLYPAAYSVCISVGATGYDDAIAPYSDGGTGLDVVAPGGNLSQDLNHDGYNDGVLSTVHNATEGDAYYFFQGTSMATPHVSGVASLLLSHGLAANQVRQALEETALDLGTPGWDAVYGYGRIDAYAALQWGGQEQTLLTENFDGGTWPPAGWSSQILGPASPGWAALNGNTDAGCDNVAHSGTNAAFHNDDQGAGNTNVRDILITPPVTIPANAQHAHLKFFQRNCWLPTYYSDSTHHWAMLSTNGTTFNMIAEFNQPLQNWAESDVVVDGHAGQQVWFAFYYQGDYATEWYVDDVSVTANVSTAADERPASLPAKIMLGDAYPNPFNSMTVIPLELSRAARVQLSVYNVMGQRVAELLPMTPLAAGTHRFEWNAANFASGIYLVRLSGEAAMTKKIILIR